MIFYPFINECLCMLASLCQLMCIFFDHPVCPDWLNFIHTKDMFLISQKTPWSAKLH